MSALPTEPAGSAANDADATETREWLDALDAVIASEGPERAHFLLEKLVDQARRSGAQLPFTANTAYVNTIPAALGAAFPGNLEIEERLRSWMRWNAMAMVVKANKVETPDGGGLGGHIASFASLATMLGIGFNHFWKGPDHPDGADLLYIQGHSAPGIYARAFLEGRLTEEQLNHFRQDVEKKGVTSYPHPRLMPEFWQFPTVSMGLGPLMAIYQARFLKYLHARGIADTSKRKVWVFCGDGEMDEPESLGAIGVAAREGLDNLVFIVNCNLQRLDGPVRGNGKIIQELEADFRGAGWNVLKVIWGSYWDPLLAKDVDGTLQRVMMETVDGEYQNYKANDGAFVRKNFFGKDPKMLEMVARMTDDEIWRLNRGGHDPHKVYAAYHAAVNDNGGKPTVILAKTVKGFGMGKIGEGKNTTHQQKKLDLESITGFRDRFGIPIEDAHLEKLPFYKPHADTVEMKYLQERRKALGGYLPARRPKSSESFKVPTLDLFKAVTDPTAEGREISTTQAFVRTLTVLLRDKELGPRVVPIIPDEARTFGMEGLFRQLGIYATHGQLYEPVDRDQVSYYREDKAGQVLEEGINEAGSMADFIAAGTSYATNDRIMIPFYIFYSMFGFQRIGDLAWAAGDIQARGFLLGGTAGRTTINGEGLQHQDGHSHVMSATIPNCVSYDPTFAHEVAVIIQDGLRRMIENQENVFYYLTVMNENYGHPGLVAGQEEGIIKGIYKLIEAQPKLEKRVQLMGSGTILREVIAARDLLEKDWKIGADVWSATSMTELARDGHDCERHNMLHPTDKQRIPYVTEQLAKTKGPIIASTDYIRMYSEQIRQFIPDGRRYHALGTDGFGRSDFRWRLRSFFEVDRHYVVIAALKALADDGAIKPEVVQQAIDKYDVDASRPNPVTQ
ncbi:pyruvate dehydrogenase (acetyl-transferring), homodimeric type [soil metagenome]